jgi:periplasmic protein CpxP/Spy
MKKLGVLLVVLLFVAGNTYAQERGSGERPSKAVEQGKTGAVRGGRPQMNPEEMIKRQTQRLVDELKLTKEQETKVTAINKKYMDMQSGNMAKMRDASDEEIQKMRDEMQKNQAEKNKEIKAVLTPEQVKLFDENQKKREAMRNSGQPRTGKPEGPQ